MNCYLRSGKPTTPAVVANYILNLAFRYPYRANSAQLSLPTLGATLVDAPSGLAKQAEPLRRIAF